MLLLKTPDSIEKNCNFALLNLRARGPLLLQSVSLFVLLCDFGESEVTPFKHQSHTMTQKKPNKLIEAAVDQQLLTSAMLNYCFSQWSLVLKRALEWLTPS